MKKLVSLLLALAMLLSCTAALADIGTPDAPVKVTMLLKDMPADDPAGQAFCKALNEKMAEQGMYVDFSFVDAPAGKYVEVMPLAVINEVLKADILYFQGNTDSTAAEQGFLEDMKPYVDGSQYLKNIMYAHNTARLENHPYLLAAAPIAVFTPVIRKDWVAQLDTYEALMAEPTVDNYLAFFKELKDKGLCEYPICVYGDHSRLDSVFGAAFGVTTPSPLFSPAAPRSWNSRATSKEPVSPVPTGQPRASRPCRSPTTTMRSMPRAAPTAVRRLPASPTRGPRVQKQRAPPPSGFAESSQRFACIWSAPRTHRALKQTLKMRSPGRSRERRHLRPHWLENRPSATSTL